MKREHAAFICPHVFENTRPVLLVCREGGDWQLLCGDNHSGRSVVVGLNHLLDRDPSLLEVMDLPRDWEAERERVNGPWRRTKIEPAEE